MSARGAWVLVALACAGFAGCRELEIPSSRASEPAEPASPALREHVTLRAEKPAGVPLHAEPRGGGVPARVADGERVEVLERREDGRWLRVRDSTGRSGWIAARYVASTRRDERPPRPPSSAGTARPESAWTSGAACERLLGAGARSARGPDSARLAAWNLRWFPDGVPGRRAATAGATDLDWLACALASLDADVIALSEIKAHPSARAKLDRVLAALTRLTAGDWRVRIDDCRPEAAQHVALAWNARRATARDFTQHGQLNPRGSACADQLRPGLGGYFRFTGGLDLEIVAVHLKSGTDPRAFELRGRSLGRLSDVRTAASARHHDDDVVVLGDFNTMGCTKCTPVTSAAIELRGLDEALARAPVPLARVPVDPPCSHYFQGRASLLDLVVAPAGMRELDARVRARAAGVCAELGCGPLGQDGHTAVDRLSDHCPILVDLVDRDLDE